MMNNLLIIILIILMQSSNPYQSTTGSNYKPFVSEKELIHTITWQEGEITNTVRLFTDLIPKNFKFYKDYGERLMNNGERMRLQLYPPAQESKDLFNLLFQLGQFFEIIGRLYSQNFNNVALEMAEPIDDAIMSIKNHKENSLQEITLKILPKAQSLHLKSERHKLNYEKLTKEAQESISRMKQSKTDPDLMYNLAEQVSLEEKASKTVKEMEEKKAKYKNTLSLLDEKNKQFITSLETLTQQHQEFIDNSTSTVKKLIGSCVNTELIHYENLNLITPEKAQVIKNFAIKQDLNSDINIADDQSLRIDLQYARQKIIDLNESSTTHQSVAPYCQYICDTSEFYTKVTDRWGRYIATMMQFLNEMNSTEKNMVKQYKDINLADKRRKENNFGPFQGSVYEFLRTLELKQKSHITLGKFVDQMVGKVENLTKTYKQEEKYFTQEIQKIAKDVIQQNDKIGKHTVTFEKQLVKISQMLSSNFQGTNEKTTNFQTLMIDYTNLTDSLKENYSNFKSFVLQSIDQQQDLVKNYKQQQQSILRAFAGIFQSLTTQEQSFVDNMQEIQKDLFNFVDVFDTDNLVSQFKCQIINRTQVEYLDTPSSSPLDGVAEQLSPRNQQLENNIIVEDLDQNEIAQLDSDNPFASVNHQSQIQNDRSDVKIGGSVRNEYMSRTSIGRDLQSKSLNLNKSSIISPIKKHFERLAFRREEVLIDEQTLKDIETLKISTTQASQAQDQFEYVPGSNIQHMKFIQDKFLNLIEGETCLETYSCAVSLKILIQGRLYVTNKRLCFHSYFNDKTIFGKETKILIPLSNIALINKKSNMLVFDNSISFITKEDKEIFFTSFVYRDEAHTLIQTQLDNLNTTLMATTLIPDNTVSENRMMGEVGIENQHEYSQGNEEVKQHSDERDYVSDDAQIQQEIAQPHSQTNSNQIKQQELVPPPPPLIYDNSYYSLTQEFKTVEQERMNQIIKTAPDLEKFTIFGYEEVINCSLKHIFMVFLNYNKKWKHLENMSLIEWLDKYPLTNIDCKFLNPQGLQDVPSYFQTSELGMPQPSEFKNWPLFSTYLKNLTHVTEKPKMMQPKQNPVQDTVHVYYVSPRTIIYNTKSKLYAIPFCDSFNFEDKLSFTQIESPGPNFKTSIKSEFRVNIIKPIMFLQGTVVKETMLSLLDTYVKGPYKELLQKKILELQDVMRQQWQQQQVNSAPNKVITIQSKPSEEEKQLLITVAPQSESGSKCQSPDHQSEEKNVIIHEAMNSQLPIAGNDYPKQEEFEQLKMQFKEMKQLYSKLVMIIISLIVLNLFIVSLLVMK